MRKKTKKEITASRKQEHKKSIKREIKNKTMNQEQQENNNSIRQKKTRNQ